MQSSERLKRALVWYTSLISLRIAVVILMSHLSPADPGDSRALAPRATVLSHGVCDPVSSCSSWRPTLGADASWSLHAVDDDARAPDDVIDWTYSNACPWSAPGHGFRLPSRVEQGRRCLWTGHWCSAPGLLYLRDAALAPCNQHPRIQRNYCTVIGTKEHVPFQCYRQHGAQNEDKSYAEIKASIGVGFQSG